MNRNCQRVWEFIQESLWAYVEPLTQKWFWLYFMLPVSILVFALVFIGVLK